MESKNPNRPMLLNWTISRLSKDELKMKLNFTNELYVSSMNDPDMLEIIIVEPYQFRSAIDNKYLDANYTLTTFLP